MLKLSTKLVLNEATIKAPNLCDRFSEEDLKAIGDFVWDGYNRDKWSRRAWERRTSAATDLALQIQKDKTFPWQGCSNIVFPLVTIATQQFHSRAYPAIIRGTDVVQARVCGEDPEGLLTARAGRISTHMSWQVLEQDSPWQEQHDRMLISTAVVGTTFMKTYFSAIERHNVSELVLARDLVLDYWAKSVEDCPRKTHVIPLFRNDIHERIMRKTYRDVTEMDWYGQPPIAQQTQEDAEVNKRKGLTPPQPDETTPFVGLEQHIRVDLDDDGYAEPYIITIEETSRTVLRIVTGFDREADIERVTAGKYRGEIISVRQTQYFTKFGFIPSPDGGIYDVGFGVLLGPINESVNSALNQIFDAGTMATTAGGFLGRGAKMRGGVYTFSPFGWQRVDSSGDDLRKNIFPLPVREPSQVLFNVVVFLVGYANRVAGASDPQVGENPGQNQPAETTRVVMAEGQKIHSAIFKRIWNSLKEEFKKLYILNAIHLPSHVMYGEGMRITREDYLHNPDDIVPAADPNVASDEIELNRAIALKQSSMTTPGYDLPVVEKIYLRALKIQNIDQVYPGPGKVPPLPNPKMMIEQAKAQPKMAALQQDMRKWAADMRETIRLNDAKIIQMHAQAAHLMAQADGVKEGHQIAAFEASIGALKAHNDALVSQLDSMLKMIGPEGEESAEGADQSGGLSGLAPAPGNAGRKGNGAAGAPQPS